jgi:hypothetical protein
LKKQHLYTQYPQSKINFDELLKDIKSFDEKIQTCFLGLCKKCLKRDKNEKNYNNGNIYYTLLTQINVWIGYELGIENYKLAISLVFIIMILEFHCVKFWFEAQTEEIKNTEKIMQA